MSSHEEVKRHTCKSVHGNCSTVRPKVLAAVGVHGLISGYRVLHQLLTLRVVTSMFPKHRGTARTE
jgi:hypothetical protein